VPSSPSAARASCLPLPPEPIRHREQCIRSAQEGRND